MAEGEAVPIPVSSSRFKPTSWEETGKGPYRPWREKLFGKNLPTITEVARPKPPPVPKKEQQAPQTAIQPPGQPEVEVEEMPREEARRLALELRARIERQAIIETEKAHKSVIKKLGLKRGALKLYRLMNQEESGIETLGEYIEKHLQNPERAVGVMIELANIAVNPGEGGKITPDTIAKCILFLRENFVSKLSSPSQRAFNRYMVEVQRRYCDEYDLDNRKVAAAIYNLSQQKSPEAYKTPTLKTTSKSASESGPAKGQLTWGQNAEGKLVPSIGGPDIEEKPPEVSKPLISESNLRKSGGKWWDRQKQPSPSSALG